MKKKKAPIIERICRIIDVPPESISKTPMIEIHGKSLLKIRDGGKILLYTRERIKIALPHTKEVITVTGSELSCAYYNLGAVGVEGCIDEVSFLNKDEGEGDKK